MKLVTGIFNLLALRVIELCIEIKKRIAQSLIQQEKLTSINTLTRPRKDLSMTYQFILGTLTAAALISILLLIKVRPRCIGCSHRDQQIGQLAQQVLDQREASKIIAEDRDRQIKSMEKLLERVMVNAGYVKPEPTEEELEEKRKAKEEAEAEARRAEELQQRGGQVYGA